MAVVDNWAAGSTFTAADEDAVAQAINGSGWLQPCVLATTGAETFTVSAGNITQIAGTSIDGSTPSVGNRILIKDAPAATGAGSELSSQPANGIYEVTSATSTSILVSRVYEMSANPPTPYVPAGEVVAVMAGTANAGLVFIVTTPNTPAAFTYGTGAIQWRPVGYLPGTGLSLSGATLSLSSSTQSDLALASSAVQSASGVLATSGSTVQVSAMNTGQIIVGNAGTPTITTLGGDGTLDAAGNLTIGTGAITFTKLRTIPNNTVIGNIAGPTTNAQALPLSATPAPSTLPMWDNNSNLSANSFISYAATTVTTVTSTILTAGSAQFQQFTGTQAQIVVLPSAITCAVGQSFTIANRSTASIAVRFNGDTTADQILVANSQATFTLVNNTTVRGVWDVSYTLTGLTGTVTSVSVTSANGFTGAVANPTSTPAISVGTSVTGLLKGDGSAMLAAVPGSDYAPATTGTAILKASAGGFANAVAGTDYAAPPSITAALKGNGAGGFSAATLNDVAAPTAPYNMGGTYTITNLPAPSNPSDAATKSYVDATAQGLSVKPACVAATVGPETVTFGTGVATAIGATIDGVTVIAGDRVLLKNCTSTSSANGIYQVNSVASGTASISRAADMSGSVNPAGAFTFVEGGTVNKSSGFVVSAPSSKDTAFTWNTTAVAFTQFSGTGQISAGAGLAISGGVISITNGGILPAGNGGTGAATLTGLIKGNGTSAFTAAVAGTDYAPATTGSSVLKASGGGFANAVAGVDYAPATSGTAVLKANGSGGFANAVAGTDFAPPTTGTGLLAGNGSGGFATGTASLNSLGTPTANFAMGGYTLTGLANPTNPQDAATKNYVDSAAWHAPCRLATTGLETFTVSSGNITQIAGTSIDGVAVAVGDRILVKDAPAASGIGSVLSTQPANGIYVVSGNTTNITVSRCTDMSATAATATPAGSVVFVETGNINDCTIWVVSSPSSAATFSYGTTAINWSPQLTVGNVLTRSGNTVAVASMSTGQVIAGNGGTPSIVTLSGDATLSASGALTITAGAVTGSKIANATIGAVNIANGAITAVNIANATITAANIANGTIIAANIANGTITTNQIANATITGTDIAADTVTVSNLAATGTASSTTYLRGDGTWGAPAGTTYSAGTGIAISGTTISTLPNSYSTTVGDGTHTSYTVTHNLGTRNVVIEVMNTSTFEIVNCDKTATTANTVTVTFQTAPSAGQYTVTVAGGFTSIGVAAGSITSTQLASGAVGITNISATGTASSTTFLRGDGSWAVPSLAASSVTMAELSTTGTASNSTWLSGTGAWRTMPYDLSIVAFGAGTQRSVGTGDFPFGVLIGRAVTLTSVTYRCSTADASGESEFVLAANGSAISGTSYYVPAASQTATNNTITGSWPVAAGTVLTLNCLSVGTTPGYGLIADILGQVV